MNFVHKPVMVNEVVGFLTDRAKVAIDFTVGGGGHAAALLKTNTQLTLFGVDRDLEAISRAREKLADFSDRVSLIHESFLKACDRFLVQNIKADFILLDLGVSSQQIDDPKRGFSFRHEGPLDMRMNQQETETAESIINRADEKELLSIIKNYGEENFANRIVRNIINFRQKQPFTTTKQLADCISQAIPKKFQFGRIHPATKTFQALRIRVNNEIGELDGLLSRLIDLLNPNGRVAIITFHSLEDRPVKKTFRKWINPCQCPKSLPQCICGLKPVARLLNKKIITATKDERETNPRSRSAKLRIAEKL